MKKALQTFFPFLIILLSILMISEKGNAQSATTDSLDLTAKDQQNSVLFKSLKGGDRVSVFTQLQDLIKVKEAGSPTEFNSSTKMGSTTAKVSQVIALLGVPDKKLQEGLIIYYLKAGSVNCKALIGVDKDGAITFCTIKDCN
jgi:hypothetical protein